MSGDPLFNVVLVEPEIPQNTGNIGRTCVALNAHLHLVGPLGFTITDRQLKRAGLDYWPHLQWTMHQNWAAWHSQVADPSRIFCLTTKGQKSHFEIDFKKGDWLVFGKETKGLSDDILQQFPTQKFKIPQVGPVRSLNVATAVAIVLYEGFRQTASNPS